METEIMHASEKLSRLHLTEKAAICIDKPQPEYVLHIDVQKGSPAKLAATSSNNKVRIYSADTLAFASNVGGHNELVTGVRFSPCDQNVLYTSSHDGTVRCWDMRNSKATQTYTTCDETRVFTALDVSCDGLLICTGTEAKKHDVQVHLWDVRKANESLRHYDESHTDDITSVRFHPEKANILLSGSTDGLVSVYDVNEEDDDESLVCTLNTESSVNRLGFCGKNSSNIYALTHIETLHLWKSEEDFDDVACLLDVRDKYSDRNIDYLVDCFQCGLVADKICILAGSNSGQGHVMSLQGQELHHEYSIDGGHNAIIRSMVWNHATSTLVTGGEDSMLCAWNRKRKDKDSTKTKEKRKSDSKLKKKVKHKVRDSSKPF